MDEVSEVLEILNELHGNSQMTYSDYSRLFTALANDAIAAEIRGAEKMRKEILDSPDKEDGIEEIEHQDRLWISRESIDNLDPARVVGSKEEK